MVAGEAGDTFRLTIRVRDRLVVYDLPEPCGYKQALAHVAHAVHRHAADGRIERVELERRVPIEVTLPLLSSAERGQPALAEDQPVWLSLERWDADVVTRILSQTPPPAQVSERFGAAALAPPAKVEQRHSKPVVVGPECVPRTSKSGNGANGHGRKPQGINGPLGTNAATTELRGQAPPRNRSVTQSANAESRRTTGSSARVSKVGSGTAAPLAAAGQQLPQPADERRSQNAEYRTAQPRSPRPARHRTTHRWHLALTVVVIGVAWIGLAAVLAGGKVLSLVGSHGRRASAVAEHLPFDRLRPPAATTRPARSSSSEPRQKINLSAPRATVTAGPEAARLGVPPGRTLGDGHVADGNEITYMPPSGDAGLPWGVPGVPDWMPFRYRPPAPE